MSDEQEFIEKGATSIPARHLSDKDVRAILHGSGVLEALRQAREEVEQNQLKAERNYQEIERAEAERDKLRALLQRARSRLSLLSAAASLVSRGIEEGGHDILGMHVLKKYQQAAELSITDIDAYLSPEQEQG